MALLLRRGPSVDVLLRLAAETGARTIVCNRHYESYWDDIECKLAEAAERAGVAFKRLPGSLLFDPDRLAAFTGRRYKVFTPFWRACLKSDEPPQPMAPPDHMHGTRNPPRGDDLADWALLPTGVDWTPGLQKAWQPGEPGGRERLAAFLDEALPDYRDGRDYPGREATSRLSPHLHFGEISVRQAWHAVRDRMAWSGGVMDGAGETFLRELGWRDFNMNLLIQFPDMHAVPIRREFDRFPWREDHGALSAWQRGRTGCPIVDAGMRELWETGWMHNRVRMIAASYLVKNLLLPWWKGEAWFWDTLVDADSASNAGNWQWVAGCGADAAPYFRIFNPVLQSRKFDSGGDYLRRWVPEIGGLPDSNIHAPWEAAEAVRAQAGISPGDTYAKPTIDLGLTRTRALAAFKTLRNG